MSAYYPYPARTTVKHNGVWWLPALGQSNPVTAYNDMTPEEIVQWLEHPPGGRFLTVEHIFFPHSYLPAGASSPWSTIFSYLQAVLLWGGGGYLLGYALDRDAKKWARNGLIIGFVTRFVGALTILAFMDWLSSREDFIERIEQGA